MSTSVQLFLIFLISGIILVGTEIFVPGGIIGTIGAIALIAAIVSGFSAFGPVIGGYVAAAIVIGAGLSIFVWMKLLPRTALGRRLTVANDLAGAKAVSDKTDTLLNKEGETVSELRPAGFAMIDGKRVDVVTQGDMIAKGMRVRVVAVEGIRVVVKRIETT
jgi:membrane-bound ClpP family serine protease